MRSSSMPLTQRPWQSEAPVNPFWSDRARRESGIVECPPRDLPVPASDQELDEAPGGVHPSKGQVGGIENLGGAWGL